MTDSLEVLNVAHENREVVFPVPWGVIAAKTWGDPCSTPVLLLHGIQDNAGTFDRLVPLLPTNFYYVGIDLPGHGRSSRLPKGYHLDFLQYLFSVDRVVMQLNWKHFTIIGHSLGGQLAVYYAAMFADKVEKIVIIDATGPHPVSKNYYMSFMRSLHEKTIQIEEKMLEAEPPSYTYEMALQKAIDHRRSPITREAAEKLLPRNLKKTQSGYYFSADQRLKNTVSLPLLAEQHAHNISSVKCPALYVMTNILHKFMKEDEKYALFYKAYKKNPSAKIVTVEGEHDVHNVSPELVAPHIFKFLVYVRSSL